jgi:hypothetical protein
MTTWYMPLQFNNLACYCPLFFLYNVSRSFTLPLVEDQDTILVVFEIQKVGLGRCQKRNTQQMKQ